MKAFIIIVSIRPVGEVACCSATSLPKIGDCKNKWGDREKLL